MDTPTNNTYRNVIITVIVVAAIVIAVVALGKPSATVAPTAVSETVSTSTVMSATSTPIATPRMSISAGPAASSSGMVRSPWSYEVTTEKKSYSQNENIVVTVKIMNMTDQTTSLNFENGCQLSYTIADFDFIKHIVCIPGGSSIVLAPHEAKAATITHYPSVYKIPVGTYTMGVSVIGYDTIPLTITITP